MRGAKHVEKHKHEIDNLYFRENVDQRQKMGPRRTLEWLKTKHHNQLDLPSEPEIKQCAASLTVKFKKHDTIGTMKRSTQESSKVGLCLWWQAILQLSLKLYRSDFQVKP